LSLAPLVEVQLIRVVQEALSNVRKHARAARAGVRLERVGEFARLTIEDDGQGFDPTHVARGQWPRFGLQSMRERVESVGGSFTIESTPGQGTKVTVQIPIVYRGEELDSPTVR
jgi:signal transduction histidine kinase